MVQVESAWELVIGKYTKSDVPCEKRADADPKQAFLIDELGLLTIKATFSPD